MQKIDIARRLLPGLLRNPNLTRADIIERLKQAAQVTHSTAVSYYERIAKELGHTNKDRGPTAGGALDSTDGVRLPTLPSAASGGAHAGAAGTSGGHHVIPGKLSNGRYDPDRELEGMESEDPNKIGIIRKVDGAHLVFKRQSDDSSFEELWIYKLDPMATSLKIKQAILAGTDIPPTGMKSPDGTQRYDLKTMGDAQMLHIKGLPN